MSTHPNQSVRGVFILERFTIRVAANSLRLVLGLLVGFFSGARVGVVAQEPALEHDRLTVLVGTYTSKDSEGVYRLELNRATGQLTQYGLVAKLEHPSFLAASPGFAGHFAAVHETGDFSGTTGGGLSILRYDAASGTAEVVAERLSHGAAPCHVTFHSSGSRIAVANYSGGSYTGYRFNDHRDSESQHAADSGPPLTHGYCFQNTGKSVNPQRQESAHGHCVRFVPGHDDLLVAADLGTDEVIVFKISETKADVVLENVNAMKLKPGCGPRQIDFHPNGQWMYVINELDNTIAQLTLPDETGQMQLLGTVPTLPEGFAGPSSTAHIQVHPSGRFLYGSNRGHDSIAMFSVDETTGGLKSLGHQAAGIKTPRHFLIEPSGRFLLVANQDQDSVIVFPISRETGVLEKSSFQAYVPTPVCLLPME